MVDARSSRAAASRLRAPLALRVALPVFALAIVADLLSKRWAVAHAGGLVYNDKPNNVALRVVGAAVAIAVAAGLTEAARRLGLGRQWGVWVGGALLVAGIAANGVSPLFWSQGVPDFIAMHGWVWNVADLEIGIGLSGGILSVGVGAVAVYVRERRQLAATRRT